MQYQIDAARSRVEFTIKKLWGLVTVKGVFGQFEGQFDYTEGQPQEWSAQVTLQADSLVTANKQRDKHIRTADFFHVEKHPTLTFRSTRVEPTGPRTFKLHGDLTIRDVTKPVVLDVEQTSAPGAIPTFRATATLTRHDWNLNWNKMPIGHDANLTIEAVGTPVAPSVAPQTPSTAQVN